MTVAGDRRNELPPARFSHDFAVLHDHFPADYSVGGNAGDNMPVERRPTALGPGILVPDLLPCLEVNHNQVGIGANLDDSLPRIEPEDARHIV